jgi:hypothetical protein
VASIHPREDWEAQKVGPEDREGLHPTIVYSIVEAIDIDTGASRGRVRFDGLVVSFPAEGLVAIREADQLGLTVLRIVEVALTEEPGQDPPADSRRTSWHSLRPQSNKGLLLTASGVWARAERSHPAIVECSRTASR